VKYEIKRNNNHFKVEELPDQKFYLDILTEQTPCDGCVHVQKCGAKRYACDAFALYVYDGQVNWTIPRLPSRRIYSQATRIGEGSSALIRNINKKLREEAKA
jgi:hypothetical protein